MPGIMFAARGLVVSFSVFVIVYCFLSLAVLLAWRNISVHIGQRPVRRVADLLFTVRMFPLMAAAAITTAFTVPSFLLLEPRATDEPLIGMPLALGMCGVLLCIFGIVNAAVAVRRASRTVSNWTSKAQSIASCEPVPILRISPAVPAMTTAGIVHPKILLSGTAEAMLTGNELRTALNHELEHVRRRDNLKKLFLRAVAFPGMAALDAAWLEATEMASDDAAVSSASDALDLAAALIKLSRLGTVNPSADLTAALVHSSASFMNARVERLIAWSADRLAPARRFSPWYGLAAALATVAVFAVTYSQLLAEVHTATEWLVR